MFEGLISLKLLISVVVGELNYTARLIFVFFYDFLFYRKP